MNTINELFTAAVLNRAESAERITAHFRDGREAGYTMRIFDLLKSDPDVRYIYSAETGEVLYEAQ